jgi:hypothetical protein
MDIDKTIENLTRETFDNKLNFSRHEAVCQTRYETLLNNMSIMSSCLLEVKSDINKLKILAESGKSSLKTVLIIGSIIGGLFAMVFTFLNYLR